MYASQRERMHQLTMTTSICVCLRLDSLQKEMPFDVWNVPTQGDCFFYCLAYDKLAREVPPPPALDEIAICKWLICLFNLIHNHTNMNLCTLTPLFTQNVTVRRVAPKLSEHQKELVKAVNDLLGLNREMRNLIVTEPGGHSFDESSATLMIQMELIRRMFDVGLDQSGSRLFEVGIGGGAVIVTYSIMFPELLICGVEESSSVYSIFISLMHGIRKDKPEALMNVRTANKSFLDLGNNFDTTQATNITMYVLFADVIRSMSYVINVFQVRRKRTP